MVEASTRAATTQSGASRDSRSHFWWLADMAHRSQDTEQLGLSLAQTRIRPRALLTLEGYSRDASLITISAK